MQRRSLQMGTNFITQMAAAVLLCAVGIEFAFASESNQKVDEPLATKQIEAEHSVRATLLFNELYDIDVAQGHYKASVEIMMNWAGAEQEYLSEIGDDVIHGNALDEILEAIWHPEFIVANAEMPRVSHYRTLSAQNGEFELFERFDVDLSIDAEMRSYPFGDLDLFIELAAFSGNATKMQWVAEEIFIGHDDARHQVVKGNWAVSSTNLEATNRKSLNHGGKEKFSYLISHVNVVHNSSTAIQKVLFPLFSIIVLSLIFNQFLNTNAIALRNELETSPLMINSMGAQLTLFLTIPALKFALEADMPATHYLNFADGLFILATLIVSFNLTVSVLTHSWAFGGFTERAIKVEHFSKYFSPLFSFAALGIILVLTTGGASH